MLVHYSGGMQMQWYDLEHQSMVAAVSMPCRDLQWCGFGEQGWPAFYSSGRLMAYLNQVWMPLVDTCQYSAGKTDFYWPVACDTMSLQVVICKAGDRQPGFPRPLITELALQVPALASSCAGANEEPLMRSQLWVSGDDPLHTAQQDKLVLQLVQQAGRAQKL